MKQAEIEQGKTYMTKVGGELAEVVVVHILHMQDTYTKRNVTRYRLRRVGDTGGLPKLRTAAAIRPCQS